jgi:hypothetical protein
LPSPSPDQATTNPPAGVGAISGRHCDWNVIVLIRNSLVSGPLAS